MAKQPLNISEEAAVQMPMKTVASLIMMVAIGTWAYFGIIETQNKSDVESPYLIVTCGWRAALTLKKWNKY